MSKWWSARVDEIDGSLDWFLNGLDDVSMKWFAVCEIASETEKMHYHAVFITKFSESKIRKSLFSKDLEKGQKSLHLILDEKELTAACQYISKGTHHGFMLINDDKNPALYTEAQRPINPDVIGRRNFPNSVIEDHHNNYWTINKKVKKEYKELKQKKNLNFVGEVAFCLLEAKANGELNIEFDSRDWTFRKVVRKFIYKHLREKAKTFDAIIIRRLQNGVMNIIDPVHMEQYMESLIDDDPDLR